jgi:hypothetical protein
MTYVNAGSLWQVVSSLGYYFNNHILYSLLARCSVTLLGESEFAARLPALGMGLLGIVTLFQFGKRFLGETSGMLASVLLALSAFHIDHSTEARGYSGLALFSILSSWYFLEGLKANELKSWMCYVLFTVLGFYAHVFMIAVSISQLFTAMVFIAGDKLIARGTGIPLRNFRHFLIFLFAAAIVTLAIFVPVLPAFVTNMGKVYLVSVNRIPFLLSLLHSLLPGTHGFLGCIFYGVLFCAGAFYIFRSNTALCVYLLTLLSLPLTLYLLLNPMFVFERYFIFALPFVLLVVSHGVIGLAGKFTGIYKKGFICFCLALMVYASLPDLGTVLSQDRQNYREAVRYVEDAIREGDGDLVFSIGYAGEHFRYYAADTSIETPPTLDEFFTITRGKKRVWCLITAWLPDIRPAYEDVALYAERPGQVEIYDYVKKHFALKKAFPSRFPVEVYSLTVDLAMPMTPLGE